MLLAVARGCRWAPRQQAAPASGAQLWRVGILTHSVLLGIRASVTATEPVEIASYQVSPGSKLQINLPFSSTPIDVKCGDLFTIKVKCSPTKQEDLRVKFEDGTVDVQEVANNGTGVLECHVPQRWCSLSLHTSGGPVHVQQLAEAAFCASTGGGNLEFGALSLGLKTTINTLAAPKEISAAGSATTSNTATAAGHITGGALRGENVNIQCAGLRVQKLTCLQAAIDSVHSGISVGAFYGDACKLHSQSMSAKATWPLLL